MRVLLDTNVVLDVLLRRGEWVSEAEGVWQASLAGRLVSCITASALTVLAVDREALEYAYALAVTDFEDAVQISTAIRAGLDAIVTRDPGGFGASPVAVWSPGQLVASLRERAPS